MTRLCVICEGQTESEFVVDCLWPYLFSQGIEVYPSTLKARPGKKGGGNVTIKRIARHIRYEYPNTDYITTLVDYYGFKQRGNRTVGELESAILAAVLEENPRAEDRRVLPYVQRHEFEALLFSDITEFRWVLDDWNPTTEQQLMAIVKTFPNPEDINDSPITAPSKRLENLFGNTFSKREHGPIIAAEIGLAKIRQRCPGFDRWLSRLVALQA